MRDLLFGYMWQVVANKFNIPKYVLYASPASALSCYLHAPELVRQGVLPTNPSRGEELIYDIPGVPPTRAADMPSPVQDSSDYVYDFFVRNAKQMQEAAGVLVNTYYELEPNCIDVLRKTTFQVSTQLSCRN
jgi:hydroquinone glucosyltransferase